VRSAAVLFRERQQKIHIPTSIDSIPPHPPSNELAAPTDLDHPAVVDPRLPDAAGRPQPQMGLWMGWHGAVVADEVVAGGGWEGEER
jgi:hypothetical protein